MHKQILDFLNNNKISVVTTLLSDGSPHSAPLHFSNKPGSLELYFSTSKESRKCEGLDKGSPVLGSVVIGFSEEEWITLQMDGELSIVGAQEFSEIQDIHYSKLPGSAKFKDKPDTVMLKFVPKWWRYSDFNTKPPTFISSES